MQTEGFSAASIDEGIERLRLELLQSEDVVEEADFSERAVIDFATLEFEVERMRKRLAIWEIFLCHARKGARTWPEVQRALTPDDLNEITRICDGSPLRDVLLDLR
jgi:hypothetical protein